MEKGLKTTLELYANRTITRAYNYKHTVKEMNDHADGTDKYPIFALMFEEIFKDRSFTALWLQIQEEQNKIDHLTKLLEVGHYNSEAERLQDENQLNAALSQKSFLIKLLFEDLAPKFESRIDNRLHHLKNGSIEQRNETVQTTVNKGQELLSKLGFSFMETNQLVIDYQQKIQEIRQSEPTLSYSDAEDKAYFIMIKEIEKKLAAKNKGSFTEDDAQVVSNVIVSISELLKTQAKFDKAQKNLRYFADKRMFKYNRNTTSTTPRADFYFNLFCDLTLTRNAEYNAENLDEIMQYVKTHVSPDLPYNFLATPIQEIIKREKQTAAKETQPSTTGGLTR